MSTFALLWYAIMCTHRTLLYPHTYALSSLFSQYIHHHAVTCDPCESPWTGRSWPVKPLNVFHMFLHMWGCAPYAPLSHSSLSHTIYWISNSDTMTSYNPSTPFFYIIGHLSDGVGFLQVWFLLVTPTPVSPWADGLMTTDSFLVFLHENKAGWQPWDLMVFVHDKFGLDRPSWRWGNVQYMEIVPYMPFFSHQRQGFVKTSPCELSQMSLTRVLLEDSFCSFG